MELVKVKAGAVGERLKARIRLDDLPFNLTGCSVVANLKKQENFDPTLTFSMLPDLSFSMTIENPEDGVVTYDYQPADLALPGVYWLEFVVTLPDLTKRIVPQQDWVNFVIVPNISGE